MGVITIRNLCKTGRAGNQLFLYAFARAYARRFNCELQIPQDWWGRKVFPNVQERPIENMRLPQTQVDSKSTKPLGYFFGATNLDIYVYAQHQIYVDFYSRADVREWFKVAPELEAFQWSIGSWSAMHLRRGDYVTNPLFAKQYCAIMEASYERAIQQFQIPGPFFKVEEGWRADHPELSKQGLGWLADFLLLRDATYLLRANSSFSLWAGWLGHGRIYSPVVSDKVGWHDVEFVEGNHENTAGVFHNQSSLHLRET